MWQNLNCDTGWIKIWTIFCTKKCTTRICIATILFSIFICQLPRLTIGISYLHLFANDTQLYYCFVPSNITVANEVLSNDLASIYKFPQSHCISLNASKCVSIPLNNSSSSLSSILNLDSNLYLCGWKKTVKSLGLILDEFLHFNHYVLLFIDKDTFWLLNWKNA